MKNTAKLFGIIALTLALAIAMASCDDSPSNETNHTHGYGTAWKSDTTQHWHECSCGEKKDIADHTWDWVTTKPATETETGLKTQTCTVCGKTSGETQTIPKTDPNHEHAFGEEWKTNAEQHWHECDCGEKSQLADHTWDWVITKPATETETGLKTETCTVCGKTSGENANHIQNRPEPRTRL